MDRIRAPYNFVPLSPTVVGADLDQRPSADPSDLTDPPVHDRPFKEGVCGTLIYEVTAHTPVFVRGSDDKSRDAPFALPDGSPALPGTSVKGMLRNVLAIATLSRMERFNDHAYSIRDLTPAASKIYGRQMSEIGRGRDGKNTILPVVSAGWFRRGLPDDAPEAWRAPTSDPDAKIVGYIELCDFAKFEYSALEGLAARRGVSRFTPGKRQSAVDKYESWGNQTLEVTFTRKVRRERGGVSQELGVPLLSEISLVDAVLPDGAAQGITGHVVFTGQPNEWNSRQKNVHRAGNAKHHDFVFYRGGGASTARYLPVTAAQFRRFQEVHADRGQQARLVDSPNHEWTFWKRVYLGDARLLGHPAPSGVPVFVLPRQSAEGKTELRAFGLAMMFRLAYNHTIKRAVTNAQRDARNARCMDIASAIFGRVETHEKKTLTLRGRVSVGHAMVTHRGPDPKPVQAVLGAPRASYFPNYFEHGDVPAATLPPNHDYRTLMDDGVRVRGWKRYPPRKDAVERPPLPQRRMGEPAGHKERNADVQSSFRPLGAGSVFAGTIRVHNLRPWELGAVLWATDFGGAKDTFHGLGLAKPFGYGRVSVRVQEATLTRNDGAPVDLTGCRKAFVEYMDEKLGGAGRWASCEVIRQLLATARVSSTPGELRHMDLRHPDHRNEFVEAKKARMSLAPAAPFDARAWAAFKARRPAPEPAKPAAPDGAAEEAECRRAFNAGNHAALLERWMRERGPLEEVRRGAALRVLGTISTRMRSRMPEITAWLERKTGT